MFSIYICFYHYFINNLSYTVFFQKYPWENHKIWCSPREYLRIYIFVRATCIYLLHQSINFFSVKSQSTFLPWLLSIEHSPFLNQVENLPPSLLTLGSGWWFSTTCRPNLKTTHSFIRLEMSNSNMDFLVRRCTLPHPQDSSRRERESKKVNHLPWKCYQHVAIPRCHAKYKTTLPRNPVSPTNVER